MKLLIGITGASGVLYAYTFINSIKTEKHLIISKNAKALIDYELHIPIERFASLCDYVYDDDDLFAPVSSGSFKIDAMVIIPASMSTVAKIANGIADTLITRAASVTLKEKRKLIIVFREMPLSTINLKNLYKLSLVGATIVPASPGLYTHPKTVEDMAIIVAGRIMDLLGFNANIPRWKKNA